MLRWLPDFLLRSVDQTKLRDVGKERKFTACYLRKSLPIKWLSTELKIQNLCAVTTENVSL